MCTCLRCWGSFSSISVHSPQRGEVALTGSAVGSQTPLGTVWSIIFMNIYFFVQINYSSCTSFRLTVHCLERWYIFRISGHNCLRNCTLLNWKLNFPFNFIFLVLFCRRKRETVQTRVTPSVKARHPPDIWWEFWRGTKLVDKVKQPFFILSTKNEIIETFETASFSSTSKHRFSQRAANRGINMLLSINVKNF